MKVFLDTGAFLALADEDDRFHTAAKPIYTELIQSKAQLFTSSFVLSETYTLIRSKVSHPAAVEFMRHLDQTGIKVLRVGEAIEQTAKAIFTRYNDKDFSFVEPPGKPGAPLPWSFDSLRSLRTTPRFSGGIPSRRPPAMAGARVEGSIAPALL